MLLLGRNIVVSIFFLWILFDAEYKRIVTLSSVLDTEFSVWVTNESQASKRLRSWTRNYLLMERSEKRFKTKRSFSRKCMQNLGIISVTCCYEGKSIWFYCGLQTTLLDVWTRKEEILPNFTSCRIIRTVVFVCMKQEMDMISLMTRPDTSTCLKSIMKKSTSDTRTVRAERSRLQSQGRIAKGAGEVVCLKA
jgi:hypothetical protein